MDKQLWDIFISHASEDKEEIARPLAKALRKAGLKVWYDEFILKPGDSISDSIRTGQNKSTYALIILSPNFFANEKWARHELKGFMTREVYEGKTIIPVWHKVTQQDVRRFAPDLADKKAVVTSRGLDVVVQEIVSLFKTKGEEGLGQIEEPGILERLFLRSEPLEVPDDIARKIFGITRKLVVFLAFVVVLSILSIILVRGEIKTAILTFLNLSPEKVYYNVKLVLPSRMSGAEIYVDGQPANILEQTPTVVTIRVEGKQENHQFIAQKTNEQPCTKTQLIQKNDETIFVCQ